MRDLTKAENSALRHLADAWNEVCLLPDPHPADLHEFSHAIHAAEVVIFARPAIQAQAGARRPNFTT